MNTRKASEQVLVENNNSRGERAEVVNERPERGGPVRIPGPTFTSSSITTTKGTPDSTGGA